MAPGIFPCGIALARVKPGRIVHSQHRQSEPGCSPDAEGGRNRLQHHPDPHEQLLDVPGSDPGAGTPVGAAEIPRSINPAHLVTSAVV